MTSVTLLMWLTGVLSSGRRPQYVPRARRPRPWPAPRPAGTAHQGEESRIGRAPWVPIPSTGAARARRGAHDDRPHACHLEGGHEGHARPGGCRPRRRRLPARRRAGVHPRASPPTTTAWPAPATSPHAKLLGIFQVSILHNIVHLLFGAAGLALARTAADRAHLLIGGGVIYLVLWIYGLVDRQDIAGQLRPAQHRGRLAALRPRLGMIALGVVLGRRPGAGTVTR